MTSSHEPSGMRYGAIERDDVLPKGTLVGAGAYRVGAVLGRGGMATVYAAERMSDGLEVALKVASAKYASRDDIAARMRNELELVAAIGDHPNLVRPLEGGRLAELGDAPYLVTDLARGPALADLIVMQRQLAPLRAVQIARDVACAVVALHERGIVHRDIKPDNIVVVKTAGRHVAKLIDFGLAATTGGIATSPRLTAVFERPGTKHYMAPEQAAGAVPDGAVDVYALGVTLFEMLVGAPPMGDRSEDEVIARKLDATQPSFSIVGVRDGLPPSLEHVVDACLVRDATARIGASALIVELERIEGELRGDAAWASDDGGVVRGQVIAAEFRARPAIESALAVRVAVPRVPRNRAVWLGMALVVIVVTGWWISTHRGAPAGPVDVRAPARPTAAAVVPGDVPPRDPIGVPSQPDPVPSVTPAPPIPASAHAEPSPVRPSDPPAAATRDPKATADPKPPVWTSERCIALRDKVAGLVDEQPTRALELLRERSCWDSGNVHRRLRVRALVAADRYDECVQAAQSSKDPEVLSYLKLCKAKANG